MILGLRTVKYPVPDSEVGRAWYAKALGFEPYYAEPFYVGFAVGGDELGLDPNAPPAPPGNRVVAYWGVADIEAEYRRLIELGAVPEEPPQEVGGGIRVATVLDPFGNSFGLIQHPQADRRKGMGKILVQGVKFHGFHGLTRIEREIGVRYSVDVEMTCDLAAAAASDSVKDTIDYRAIHHTVVEVGRANSYHLIETLADRLAGAILRTTAAEAVLIRVRKETPILDGIVDAVSVELYRERKDA